MAKTKVSKKAPMKECPKCKAKVHTRKATCDCGYKFRAKAKPKTAPKTKAAKPAPKAPSLTSALKAERATLQKRIAKIDDLLDTYQ
jgi:hypothetical protein